MVEVAFIYDNTGKSTYKYSVIYGESLNERIKDFSFAVKEIISTKEFEYIINIPLGKITEIEKYVKGKLNQIEIFNHL